MMEYTAQVILLLPVKRNTIKLHNRLPAAAAHTPSAIWCERRRDRHIYAQTQIEKECFTT